MIQAGILTFGLGEAGTGDCAGLATDFRPLLEADIARPGLLADEVAPGAGSAGENVPESSAAPERRPLTLADQLKPVMLRADEED